MGLYGMSQFLKLVHHNYLLRKGLQVIVLYLLCEQTLKVYVSFDITGTKNDRS